MGTTPDLRGSCRRRGVGARAFFGETIAKDRRRACQDTLGFLGVTLGSPSLPATLDLTLAKAQLGEQPHRGGCVYVSWAIAIGKAGGYRQAG